MKYSAMGTRFRVGIKQVERAKIVGTITTTGNATVVLTSNAVSSSPLSVSVAVLDDDTADVVAVKVAAELNLDADVVAAFTVFSNGPYVIMQRLVAAANDTTLNLACTNDTCAGLTPDPASDAVSTGRAFMDTAQVSAINDVSLEVTMVDATTLDSPGAAEEFIATTIKTSEPSLELLFDPKLNSHDAASGLLWLLLSKRIVVFSVIFPTSNYEWLFDGYVESFRATTDKDGALLGKAGLHTTGVPELE